MPTENQSILQHFKAKKSEKNSFAQQEARRLVNLYRSLSCFGDDFLNEYNQMLLDVKPNVRRLLGTFVGGEEVEDYLEFLHENAHLTKEEVKQNTENITQTKGYLPTPDMDVALTQTGDTITISREEWQKMKERAEFLEKKLRTLTDASKTLKTAVSDFENYSEIIEEGQNNG